MGKSLYLTRHSYSCIRVTFGVALGLHWQYLLYCSYKFGFVFSFPMQTQQESIRNPNKDRVYNLNDQHVGIGNMKRLQ